MGQVNRVDSARLAVARAGEERAARLGRRVRRVLPVPRRARGAARRGRARRGPARRVGARRRGRRGGRGGRRDDVLHRRPALLPLIRRPRMPTARPAQRRPPARADRLRRSWRGLRRGARRGRTPSPTRRPASSGGCRTRPATPPRSTRGQRRSVIVNMSVSGVGRARCGRTSSAPGTVERACAAGASGSPAIRSPRTSCLWWVPAATGRRSMRRARGWYLLRLIGPDG